MMAKLLHIANSDPPSNKYWRERFYAMKNRILHRWAKPDGFDLQAFDGKTCWNCGGDGLWDEFNECHRCDGTGWYRSPRVIRLNRWRLGRYTFHQPILTAYRSTRPEEKITFRGRVEHTSYNYQHVLLSTFLLAIFYDWVLARWAFGQWLDRLRVVYKLRAIFTRKCYRCGRRLWSWNRWSCSETRLAGCQLGESRVGDDDEEMPF